MNILTDFSDTLVSAITTLYVLTSFTIILRLCQKLSKAKSTIDSLRIHNARVFTPTKSAPAPPPNPSEFEKIFESNLNSIYQIRYLIKMFFHPLEKEHRAPTPHELQYLHSLKHILSALDTIANDIVDKWEAYTKNFNPENEKQ